MGIPGMMRFAEAPIAFKSAPKLIVFAMASNDING